MGARKHTPTPGPWFAVYGNLGWCVKHGAKPTTFISSGVGARIDGSLGEEEANAHLIAAAPEQNEALVRCGRLAGEAISTVVNGRGNPVPALEEIRRIARAALAKAKGGGV